MSIAVTGATGHLGRIVIEHLKQGVAAADIVALARNPEKAATLGVEVHEADYDRPETLEQALTGMNVLVLISANEVGRRAAQHQNIIDAAQVTGIDWIVYTSLLHADSSPLGLAKEHHQTEIALKESEIPFTILRNGWYTENYTGSIQGAAASGTLLGCAGNGRIASAARSDYAEAAAAVVTGKGHEGKVYELAGDHAWTMADLAAEISRQSGKDVAYKNLGEAEYANALKEVGVPGPMAEMIAGWDVATEKGALFDDGRQLSGLIGRPTTPMAETVRTLL